MPTRIPSNKYCTVSEFARLRNMSKAGVYKALNDKRLNGYKIESVWLIPINAIIESARLRDGSTIGIADLKRGDMESFLQKRGIRKMEEF